MRPVRRESTGASGSSKVSLAAGGRFGADDLGLSSYTAAPPSTEVSIREFEELACDRLKVLHAFDRLCGFDVHLNQIAELKPRIQPELVSARLTLNYPIKSNEDSFEAVKAEFCRRDALSHFVLRLAFCKSRESREWFMRQEQRLFVLRFESLQPEAKEAFFMRSGLPCKRFEQEPGKTPLLRELQACTAGAKIWGDGPRPEHERVFYEMPFQEVHPNLIATRKVVVRGGRAFVPGSALKLILAGRFKETLAAGLDVAFQGLPQVLADPRVGGFVKLLQEHGLQLLVAPKSNKEDPGEKLSLGNFEELLMRSFPPCMRRNVEQQRDTKKHLKHQGRLQLRPFLKDAGFDYDSSMRWWKQELTRDREIDVTVFEKNYAYDVDHAYGKKGHMQGQNTCACPKIIAYPHEAAGQTHGCPFSQLDKTSLKQLMHKWHLPEPYVTEVERLVSHGNHYQLACIEYFKGSHQGHEGEGVGNAPLDFFRESCRHHVQKKEKQQGAGPSQAAASAAA